MFTHTVIIIPGLGDETDTLTFVTSHWKKFGLTPIVYSVGWRDGENEFEPKLQRLVALTDSYTKQGNMVSLVGTSAGGSAVLNAYILRKNTIHRVITVCSRLRTGTHEGFRSFEKCTSSSLAFAESIKLLERNEPTLTKKKRAKIMTVRAMFGDELVPGNTATIEGAYNMGIPTIEHMVSIGLALTVFAKPIISFLNKDL